MKTAKKIKYLINSILETPTFVTKVNLWIK